MDVDSSSSRAQVRAGGTVLSLLAGSLCVPILRAHLEGPLRMPDLRNRLGGTAQTTLRGQVANLRTIGALERRVFSGMPYTVENELTGAGQDILAVADAAESWLSRAPHGPLAIGSEPAKGAIRALVAGWESSIIGTLVARPRSLTALDGAIAEISYPSLERRLSALRAARQVEMAPGGAGAAKPYSVTEWTRLAVTSLVAASRCEGEHERLASASEPLTPDDIKVFFLLAAPLAVLPPSASGSCCLAVGETNGEESSEPWTGVGIEIERGEVVSCASASGPPSAAWATGRVESWAAAILDGCAGTALEFGGDDPGLAEALVQGMCLALR